MNQVTERSDSTVVCYLAAAFVLVAIAGCGKKDEPPPQAVKATENKNVSASYKPTGASRNETLKEDAVLCADPASIVKITQHQSANNGQLGEMPDECAISTQEYKVAVLRSFELEGIKIAQIELSEEQQKPAYVRVGRYAPQQARANDALILRAGSLLCDSAQSISSAAGILHAQPNNPYIDFPGCSRIQTDVAVRLLGPSIESFYQELVQVGNAGGSGWVRKADLN